MEMPDPRDSCCRSGERHEDRRLERVRNDKVWSRSPQEAAQLPCHTHGVCGATYESARRTGLFPRHAREITTDEHPDGQPGVMHVAHQGTVLQRQALDVEPCWVHRADEAEQGRLRASDIARVGHDEHPHWHGPATHPHHLILTIRAQH